MTDDAARADMRREGRSGDGVLPAYVRLAREGRQLDALRVIIRSDPLPHITGCLCPERGTDENGNAVDIGAYRLAAARAAFDELVSDIRVPARNGQRAAVVGAGPAGLAAAVFLARGGIKVTVFDKRQSAGGMTRFAVPAGRIELRDIRRDAALVRACGVNFCFGCEVRSPSELAGFDHIVLCTGAGVTGAADIDGARPAADFLAAAGSGLRGAAPGKNVAVLGGGRLAAAAALAAQSMRGVKSVTLVFRKDAAGMTADASLIRQLTESGVRLGTLLMPVEWKDRSLLCENMALGASGSDGRRQIIATGAYTAIPADTVVGAMEERPDAALYRAFGLEFDEKGRPVCDPETGRTGVENVYLAGDGATGPADIPVAIAGAARTAAAICGRDMPGAAE